MSTAPTISICIPTYGRARHISATLESIVSQTRSDFEIVVVDDDSPDGTQEVVQQFRDSRIRFFRNTKNKGVPANYSHALSLARGRFLSLVEDHDILEPEYIESTVSILETHHNVGFAATGIQTIDDAAGKPLRVYVADFDKVTNGRSMLRRLLTRTDCPFSLTTMMRREVLDHVFPWFDERYWWYADIHLWMRLLAIADFGYVSRPLLRFREREVGHVLDSSYWETAMCLDRIHRDDWHLLHSRHSLAALRDALQYEIAKIKSVAGMKGGKIARGEDWTTSDAEQAARYLSFPSRAFVSSMNLVPRSVYRGVRAMQQGVD